MILFILPGWEWFLFQPWHGHINQVSWILQLFTKSSLQHTSVHMLLYNLILNFFGKFCIQSFESQCYLHSPFIWNFWIEHVFLANRINTFCTTSTPFLIMIGLKALLKTLKKSCPDSYFSWPSSEFSVHSSQNI